MDDHPVRLVVTDDLRRSRLTVLFRLLLAIPHIVWLALWGIAAVVAALANWVAALATGQPAAALHRFLARYLRYGLHVTSYLAVAANPYPGFTGEPGYPVDVDLPEPTPQRRLTVLLRLPLAVPALLLAAALGSGIGDPGSRDDWWSWTSVGGAASVCGLLGWFASLATGRMPNGLRDLAAYGLGYSTQAWAYLLLLTDRYPDSDPDRLGPWSLPPHPVTSSVEDDLRRSRLTVVFRLPLALPHLVWATLWSVAALFAGIGNWVVTLVRGRPAEPLHRFLAAYVRYLAHVTAFVFLVANPFPGFTGAPGYPVDVTLPPPAPQPRLVTLFRLFLGIPALLVSSAYGGALFVLGVLGWFFALATGRMPEGLRNLGVAAVRYSAQTDAYWLLVTDAYPYASPAVRAARAARVEPVEPVEPPVH